MGSPGSLLVVMGWLAQTVCPGPDSSFCETCVYSAYVGGGGGGKDGFQAVLRFQDA